MVFVLGNLETEVALDLAAAEDFAVQPLGDGPTGMVHGVVDHAAAAHEFELAMIYGNGVATGRMGDQ